MGEEVEGHEGHQKPVSLGPRELSFGQIHSVENSHEGEDLGGISCEKKISSFYVNTEGERERVKEDLPMNQWTQLNNGLMLSLGEQRIRARKGCMKQRPTVTKPMKAWGLWYKVWVMPWTSSRMRMKPAMVRPQVIIMKVRCQMNHWSRL